MPCLDQQLPQPLNSWLRRQVGDVVESISLLSGGKNNQTLLIQTPSNHFVLKLYYKDNAQRFRHETEFVSLLQSFDVKGVPGILAKAPDLNAALYNYIPGHMPKSISANMVQATADWIASINQKTVRLGAHEILDARGGLPDVAAFFNDVETRRQSLLSIATDSEVDKECYNLVSETMVQVLSLLNKFRRKTGADNWQLARCLSPSDIGFHNSLLLIEDPAKNGVSLKSTSSEAIMFVDFEYAGWDSAAKLLCDFFAQPRFSISGDLMSEFAFCAFDFLDTRQLLQQCKLLLPMAHIKWALIFLNDFKYADQQRRDFAVAGYDAQLQKRVQLEKAQKRVAQANLLAEEMA